MSRYGPDDEYPDQPGEPYRPPSDPWAGRQDPWTDLTVPQSGPADRPSGAHRRPPHPGQGGPPPPADQPTWGQPPPGGPPPGWVDQPTWAAPPPGGQQWEPGPPGRRGREPGPPGRPGRGPGPARRRGSGPLVALVVVLVLLVAGGVAATLYWAAGDGTQPGAGPTGSPSGGTSPTVPAGTEEDEDAPADRIGMGPAVAQPGDCLINEGTSTEPAMRIVACDSDSDTLVYRVLARFDTQVEGDTPEEQDRSAQEVCAGTEDYAHHYRLVAENADDSFVLCLDEE